MSTSTPLTFRDFASQIFSGDLDAAARTLVELLALDESSAKAAAQHFQQRTSDPTFLPKAMSLRTAIDSADDGAVAALLSDCFNLSSDAAAASTKALRARYSKPV